MVPKYRPLVEHCAACGMALDERAAVAPTEDTWCEGCDQPLCATCSRAHDGLCIDCEEEITP